MFVWEMRQEEPLGAILVSAVLGGCGFCIASCLLLPVFVWETRQEEPLGTILVLAVMGDCRFCIASRLLLPVSMEMQNLPLVLAFLALLVCWEKH